MIDIWTFLGLGRKSPLRIDGQNEIFDSQNLLISIGVFLFDM